MNSWMSSTEFPFEPTIPSTRSHLLGSEWTRWSTPQCRANAKRPALAVDLSVERVVLRFKVDNGIRRDNVLQLLTESDGLVSVKPNSPRSSEKRRSSSGRKRVSHQSLFASEAAACPYLAARWQSRSATRPVWCFATMAGMKSHDLVWRSAMCGTVRSSGNLTRDTPALS